MNKTIEKIVVSACVFISFAVLFLSAFFAFYGHSNNQNVLSQPSPPNGTAFASRLPRGYPFINITPHDIFIVYDGAVYLGMRNNTNPSTTLSRISMIFDGQIYITDYVYRPTLHAVTRLISSPYGIIFNNDGSATWVSQSWFCPKEHGQPGVDFVTTTTNYVIINGQHHFAWKFDRVHNIELDRLQNAPTNLSINDFIISYDFDGIIAQNASNILIEKTGEDGKLSVRKQDLLFIWMSWSLRTGVDFWRPLEINQFPLWYMSFFFPTPGDFEFRLRHLGGQGRFCENGYLIGVTVSSAVSECYVVVSVGGYQLQTPNLRIEKYEFSFSYDDIDFSIYLHWDPIAGANRYFLGGLYSLPGWLFDHTVATTSIRVGHVQINAEWGLSNWGLRGTYRLFVSARHATPISFSDGTIVVHPDSEPAVIYLTIYEDGTFSYIII